MRFSYIDCLRGVAILMVILVHSAAGVENLSQVPDLISKYCQTGVQLFFVVSAYTLCLSSEKRGANRANVMSFYIRRVFRIVPVYWFGIILYTLVAYFNIFDKQHLDFGNYTTKNILANVFFYHGFVPIANNFIVPGGWSIAVEMCFYLIFPFLIALANKVVVSHKANLLFISSGIVLSQIIIILLTSMGFVMENNGFLYFNIVNQLPCFFIGMSYFYYLKFGSFRYNWKWNLVGLALFTVFALLLWRLKIGYLFSWIPILASISFIFLMDIFRLQPKFGVNVLQKIGEQSYSMYLFHFMFVYSIDFLPISLRNAGSISLITLFLTIVLLSFIVGKISFQLLERPFTRLASKIISKINQKEIL